MSYDMESKLGGSLVALHGGHIHHPSGFCGSNCPQHRPQRPQEARTASPLRNVPQPPPTPSESLTRALSVPSYPQTQESLSDQLRALRVAAVKMGLYDADDWLAKWA